MSKQIDSFMLPDNIIKEMKDKIKETKKRKIELGFSLCTDKDITDKDKNIITKGTECVGTECIIKTGECKKDQIYIGNYHTHPKGPASLSITDMTTGCLEDIECVGSAPFNNIRCFVRKTDKSQCYNEVIPFEEEEHKMIERRRNIISAFRHPTQIVKMGIPRFIKEFRQYETEIGKYHINRTKLLNKHFNRSDIK